MKWYEEKAKLVLPTSHGRSAGLHISEVIRDYALESGVLDKKWVTEIAIEDQNTNLMQVGLAWENYLADFQHPEIEFHPGELYVDDEEFCRCGHDEAVHKGGKYGCNCPGCECLKFKPMRIYMSPDGISDIDPDDYASLFRKSAHFCHEFKFTQKSSNDFLDLLRLKSPKTLMWQWQIMCYCKAMDTLAAKLHVLFIAGNYKRDNSAESKTDYKIFRAEYEPQDIESNWIKFRNHARDMTIARLSLAA